MKKHIAHFQLENELLDRDFNSIRYKEKEDRRCVNICFVIYLTILGILVLSVFNFKTIIERKLNISRRLNVNNAVHGTEADKKYNFTSKVFKENETTSTSSLEQEINTLKPKNAESCNKLHIPISTFPQKRLFVTLVNLTYMHNTYVSKEITVKLQKSILPTKIYWLEVIYEIIREYSYTNWRKIEIIINYNNGQTKLHFSQCILIHNVVNKLLKMNERRIRTGEYMTIFIKLLKETS